MKLEPHPFGKGTLLIPGVPLDELAEDGVDARDGEGVVRS